MHSAISRFCVHGHWTGYAGAISNAKYHQVTLNLVAEKSPIVQLCSVQMTASPEPSVSTTVGSPILFDRAYFDELLHLPEKAGGSHVLRQHPDVVQYVTAEVPEELMDVDTPEELKRLENLVTIE